MNQFVEIGPKPVLGGLVRMISKQVEVMQTTELSLNRSEICDIQGLQILLGIVFMQNNILQGILCLF